MTILTSDDAPAIVAHPTDVGWEGGGVTVGIARRGDAWNISVTAPETGVARVAIRFPWTLPSSARIIGDAWERAYGDLHWGPQRPERILPWYWAWYDPSSCCGGGAGVMLRPGAFCSWSVDGQGASLWLDLHNGGEPVRLGSRTLDAATVTGSSSEGGPNDVLADLCEVLSAEVQPRGIGPVVGANNWYHAYGRGFDPAAVLRDAETIASLCAGEQIRPYSVVDAGWARGGDAHGGPWSEGLPGRFDDMGQLASRIVDEGCRPGLWLRPGVLSGPQGGLVERPGPRPSHQHRPLDLTVAENLDAIEEAVARITGEWGFRLIKHDFTFYDLFGRHGREISGVDLTEPGWRHADPTVTNAEILRSFYDRIRRAAGDAVILGCGVPGHLAAGAIDIQRVGCDTSGIHWERTRRMGVNSLAFRQSQNNRFFVADPDCVPSTPATPWSRNRQFLDVVARSGAALFVSIDPRTRSEVGSEIRDAIELSVAVQAGRRGTARPVSTLASSQPSIWESPDERVEYDWLEPIGAWPLPVR